MILEGFELIKVETKLKIGIIQFNRVDKKNAFSEAMRTEILSALDILNMDKRIKAVIFYGGEDLFSAGFDKNEVQAVIEGTGDMQHFVDSNNLFHRTLLQYPKLLIAAVNGYALAGAFDLAIICHLRVASKTAIFGHPEIRFGACPLFFPYMMIVGRGKAIELVLNTGTRETFLGAEEAYRLNIINKLVEPEKVLAEAIKLGKEIYKSPAFAVNQLLQVSNAFFNQYDSFKAEIDTILKSVNKLEDK